MKSFWIILALGCVGLGAWLLFDNHRSAQEAQARARMEARERMEQERRERAEMLAKEDAVLFLKRYIATQKDQIEHEVKLLKVEYELVDTDSKSLFKELAALEQSLDRKVAAARQTGRKFREKIEYVEELLESKVVDRLAQQYLDEDFASKRIQFKSHIRQMIQWEDETAARLAANRKKYYKEMKEINADVDTKLNVARTQLDASTAAIGMRAARYREELASESKRRDELRRREQDLDQLCDWRRSRDLYGAMLAPWEQQEARDLELRIEFETSRLEQQREIFAQAQANKAHFEATVASDSARRRGDEALRAKTEEDAAAQSDELREKTYFLLATDYEDKTLGQLRSALNARRLYLSAQLAAHERKLRLLSKSVPNMDFLSAAQVKGLQRKLVGELEKTILIDLTHLNQPGGSAPSHNEPK